MEKIEKYELIERYLANELSEQEQRDFESQLEADSTFYDDVQIHKELDGLLSDEGLHKFLGTLRETDTNWQLPSAKKEATFFSLNAKLLISIAAALLIVVFSWQFLFIPAGSSSTSQLFVEHFEPYQLVLSQRSASDPSGYDALFNQAIQEYADGDYTSAAESFRQLHQLEPDNVSYKFYFALSLLGVDNASTAITLLNELVSAPDHLFTEQSRWYLALAYLSADEQDRAIEVLENINPGQYQYIKSQEIIGEID